MSEEIDRDCTAIVSRLTAREPAVIGGSTVRPLVGFSWRDWGIGLLTGENRRFCAVSMNWNRGGRGACVGFYVGSYGYDLFQRVTPAGRRSSL